MGEWISKWINRISRSDRGTVNSPYISGTTHGSWAQGRRDALAEVRKVSLAQFLACLHLCGDRKSWSSYLPLSDILRNAWLISLPRENRETTLGIHQWWQLPVQDQVTAQHPASAPRSSPGGAIGGSKMGKQRQQGDSAGEEGHRPRYLALCNSTLNIFWICLLLFSAK